MKAREPSRAGTTTDGDAETHPPVELLHGAFLAAVPARGGVSSPAEPFSRVLFASGTGAASGSTTVAAGIAACMVPFASRHGPSSTRRGGQILLLHPDGTVAGAIDCPVPDHGHRCASTEPAG